MSPYNIKYNKVTLLSALVVFVLVLFPEATAQKSQSQGQEHQENQGSSTGTAGSGGSPHDTKISSLSDAAPDSIGLPVDTASLYSDIMSKVHISLECDTLWKGPSAKNDIFKCLSDTQKLKKNWRALVLPGLSALIFALLLVGYPVVCLILVCRCLCCTPKKHLKRKTARCCVWLLIVYALLWAVLVLFLILSGAQLLIQSLPGVIDDIESGPLHYLNSTAETLIDFTSDWSTGVRKPIHEKHVDITPFYRVQDQVRDTLKDARQRILSHLGTISTVSYCVGSIGFVLVLLIVPFAYLHCCIPFFPLIISVLYWIFGLIFSVLGALLIVVSIGFAAGCGEVELQYRRQPGVFQWYVVPYCQELFDFEQVHETVRTTESQVSIDACKKLLEACDNKPDPSVPSRSSVVSKIRPNAAANTADIPDFGELKKSGGLQGISGLGQIPPGGVPPGGVPPGGVPPGIDISKLYERSRADIPVGIPDLFSPEDLKNFDTKNLPGELKDLIKNGLSNVSFKPMRCGGSITDANQCEDFATLAHVLLSSEIKAFTTACPIKGKPCGVVECAFNCTVPFVTNVAREIMDGALKARNATIALSYARPLLEWNFMIDKVAGALKRCNDFRTSMLMMGGGFALGGLMFLLAIYIAFRGSCIWKSTK